MNKIKYIKISKNQLRILDSLYIDGSYEKKYFKCNKCKYTEHFGILKFSKSNLKKIVIDANIKSYHKNDPDILVPNNCELYKYQYIFHTHPSTPQPLSRLNENILYEFPSIDDIFHFIDHFNNGNTLGSLVICAEGVYIITTLNLNKKIILKNEKKIYNKLNNIFSDIQSLAIQKYYKKLNIKFFFKKIIYDKYFIKLFNNHLNKINIKIKYYPRIKINKKYILN